MWLISCSSLMGFFIGTWRSCEQFRIGNWNFSIFMDVIYGVLLRGIGEDKICWTPIKSRGSDVSNYYQAFLGVSNLVLPLEKYLEAKGSFQDCVFCLDCNFGNYFDY